MTIRLPPPLDEWADYRGSTPRPEGFDAYWTGALAELDDTPPEPSREPAEFALPGVRFEHLWFTGVGGARVHAKLARPADPTDRSVPVVHFHGYRFRSPDWTELLPWTACGATVVALDCRGQAGLSEDVGPLGVDTARGHLVRGLADGPRSLLYRSVFLDAVRLARLAAELPGVDPARLATHGGSQGGGLALACAALEPRVRRVAAFYPFLCDYKGVWETGEIDDSAYAEIRAFFEARDPRHQRADEWWTRLGFIDVIHLCPRIGGEVLLGVSGRDPTTPPRTQMAAWNALQCEKRLLAWPDYGHSALHGWGDEATPFLVGHHAPA